MKKILFALIVAGLSLLTAKDAAIESISGRVQISKGSGWITAKNGDVIPPGAVISTGFKSTCVLNTGDAEITVAQLTRLTLEELVEQNDTVSTTLFLNGGKINTSVSRERVRQDFTVRSPIATASVRGTSFNFDGKNLEVLTGLVLVESGRGFVIAQKGDRINSGGAGETPPSRTEALAEQTGVSSVLSILTGEEKGPSLDGDKPDLALVAAQQVFNAIIKPKIEEAATLVIDLE